MNQTLEDIRTNFAIEKIVIRRDNLAFCTVPRERCLSLLIHLKHNRGMKHLVLISAVDYIEDAVFQLTYILNNPDKKFDIAIRVDIDRGTASMESAHGLWPTAATYQRELHEMYGIDFPGSPGLSEPLVLEGWDNIPPNRRDFDTLKYSEKTFFPREGRYREDPKEHMKKEIYGDWDRRDSDDR